MADEYIKREDAIEECNWHEQEFCESKYVISSLRGAIKGLPSADVAPVVHGKWENQSPVFCWNKYGFYQTAYKCSVCGEMTPIDYNICPWCGATMDGGT